jgi:hypothetical protein
MKNYVKSLTGKDYSSVDREGAGKPRQKEDYRVMLPEEWDIGRMPDTRKPKW